MLILDALDQRILAQDWQQAEQHIRGCTECQKYQQSMSCLLDQLHNLPKCNVPKNFKVFVANMPHHAVHRIHIWNARFAWAASILLCLSLSWTLVKYMQVNYESVPLHSIASKEPASEAVQEEFAMQAQKGLEPSQSPNLAQSETISDTKRKEPNKLAQPIQPPIQAAPDTPIQAASETPIQTAPEPPVSMAPEIITPTGPANPQPKPAARQFEPEAMLCEAPPAPRDQYAEHEAHKADAYAPQPTATVMTRDAKKTEAAYPQEQVMLSAKINPAQSKTVDRLVQEGILWPTSIMPWLLEPAPTATNSIFATNLKEQKQQHIPMQSQSKTMAESRVWITIRTKNLAHEVAHIQQIFKIPGTMVYVQPDHQKHCIWICRIDANPKQVQNFLQDLGEQSHQVLYTVSPDESHALNMAPVLLEMDDKKETGRIISLQIIVGN